MSLECDYHGHIPHDYNPAALQSLPLVEEVFAHLREDPQEWSNSVLNVNFPSEPREGGFRWRVTQQGSAIFKDEYVQRAEEKDENGVVIKRSFKLQGKYLDEATDLSIDSVAVRLGYNSCSVRQ